VECDKEIIQFENVMIIWYKGLVFIIIVFCSNVTFGQIPITLEPLKTTETVVVSRSDSLPSIKGKGLHYIHNPKLLPNLYKVGTVQITAATYNKLMLELQNIAFDLFVNAYYYRDHKQVEDLTNATFDLFSIDQQDLLRNQKDRETNVIYFLGYDKDSQAFKLNGEKVLLEPNEILRYEIPKNEEVKINKGGLFGTTVRLQWIDDQPVIFYAFGTGNISSSSNLHNSIQLNFTTGSILKLIDDWAYLLLDLKPE